jgi:hypothetical protein
MVFNCVELFTQQLRKFSATFAVAVVASSCAKGRCLTDFEPVPSGATAVCMTAGGKRRQLAANYQRQKASYCGKFVAAFCRYLLPRFCSGFSATISLGDGVYPKFYFLKVHINAISQLA